MYTFNHYNFKSGRLPPSPDHIELGKFTPRQLHIQLNNQIIGSFVDFVWEWAGGLAKNLPYYLVVCAAFNLKAGACYLVVSILDEDPY